MSTATFTPPRAAVPTHLAIRLRALAREYPNARPIVSASELRLGGIERAAVLKLDGRNVDEYERTPRKCEDGELRPHDAFMASFDRRHATLDDMAEVIEAEQRAQRIASGSANEDTERARDLIIDTLGKHFRYLHYNTIVADLTQKHGVSKRTVAVALRELRKAGAISNTHDGFYELVKPASPDSAGTDAPAPAPQPAGSERPTPPTDTPQEAPAPEPFDVNAFKRAHCKTAPTWARWAAALAAVYARATCVHCADTGVTVRLVPREGWQEVECNCVRVNGRVETWEG